jgi:hypothetical protein
MALIKGTLASFSDPLLGIVPTLVIFQYNPTELTRVFRTEGGDTGGGAPVGGARNAARPAIEEYSLRLELDATDGLEKGGPLTLAMGISPRLAAIEMLMQPVGSSLLGGLAGSLFGGGGATIPAGRAPLTLFLWGPGRITPVRLRSLTVHETAFDELLNPIHASADLGFTVLRLDDLDKDDTVARAAATYYQGSREVKAVLQIPQMIELSG